MKKIYYHTECKDMTNTEVAREERIAIRDAEKAEQEYIRCGERVEKFHMELNYRLIPEARETEKTIGKIRSELKRQNLSKTRKVKLERSLKTIEASLLTMLKYGDSYRKPAKKVTDDGED